MITFYPDGSKTDTRTLSEVKESRALSLRAEVTHALDQAGIDSATQQNAALGIYGTERALQISQIVKACRDEYWRCKTQIEAASTNSEVDEVYFIAPEASDIITAEQAVAKYFSAYQIAALQRLEMALLQAGKPLGTNMTALKSWMEGMLVASVDPTPRTFPVPPCSYEDAASEAVVGLQS